MVFIKAPELAAREGKYSSGDCPNTDSCSPASPRSPCQLSQAWPGLRTTCKEIKRWFSQCLLHVPLDFHTAWQLSGECVGQELILVSLSWTMNNAAEGSGVMKVKLDLREPTKPKRCVPAMVIRGIQGSGYSKLSALWSAGSSLISPAGGLPVILGKNPGNTGQTAAQGGVCCSFLQGFPATDP